MGGGALELVRGVLELAGGGRLELESVPVLPPSGGGVVVDTGGGVEVVDGGAVVVPLSARLASCTIEVARAASTRRTASTAEASVSHTPSLKRSGKYL